MAADRLMEGLVRLVGGCAAGGTLLLTGLLHMRNLGEFKGALKRQQLWPAYLLGVIAGSVGLVETVLGGFGLLLLAAAPSASATSGVLGAISGVYASYTAYLWFLKARRPGTPCGCTASETEPLTGFSVLRAAVFTGFGLSAWVVGGSSAALSGLNQMIAVVAAVALAALIWSLPAAFRRHESRPLMLNSALVGSISMEEPR